MSNDFLDTVQIPEPPKAAPIARAIELLAAMVRERREIDGYMLPEHQRVMREASELLAEYGIDA